MCVLLLGDSSADVKLLGEIWAEHDDQLLAMEAQRSSKGGVPSKESFHNRATSFDSVFGSKIERKASLGM